MTLFDRYLTTYETKCGTWLDLNVLCLEHMIACEDCRHKNEGMKLRRLTLSGYESQETIQRHLDIDVWVLESIEKCMGVDIVFEALP